MSHHSFAAALLSCALTIDGTESGQRDSSVCQGVRDLTRFTIDFERVAMSNPVESGAAAETIRTVGQWQVPALGAGTWALGGPWEFAGATAGWGEVDDEVSIAAVRAA
jgi:hypothetical protein